uniref:Uncharacterized protein n=1 Tax=Hemiselmis andersenii TaxID=464988 RepID=A0A7S0Y0X2_HEMAN
MEDDEGLSYLALNVLQSKSLNEAMDNCTRPSAMGSNWGVPVRTLDQLQMQAFLLHDAFLDVVVQLARLHGGKFRLSSPAEGEEPFAAWEGDEASRSKFKLGGIKSVSSCVAKLDAAYGRDVSMLLDVCRETLYFDTVADLCACLTTIAQDPLLEVVQVKSTMDDQVGEDGSASGKKGRFAAGMRFVRINVRLVGVTEARDMCVDAHVCELLLILGDIGRVQTAKMRRNFREWRRVLRSETYMWRFARFGRARPRPDARGSQLSLLHRGSTPGGSPAQSPTLSPVRRLRDPSQGASRISSLSRGNSKICSRLPTFSSFQSTSAASPLAKGKSSDVGSSDQTRTERWALPVSELERQDSQDSHKDSLSFGLHDEQLNTSGSNRVSLLVGGEERHPEVGANGDLYVSDIGDEDDMHRTKTPEIQHKHVTSWGLEVPRDVVELLEGLSRLSAVGLSDFLDRRIKLLTEELDFSGIGSLFFSQLPVTLCLQRWPWQLLLAIIGLYFTFSHVNTTTLFITKAHSDSFGPYKHYRLETMLTRSGLEGANVPGPGVSDFGTIRKGQCILQGSFPQDNVDAVARSFSAPVGSSFLVSYANATSMSGWYLKTALLNDSQALDPAYFNVWGSNESPEIGDGSCALGRVGGRWFAFGSKEEAVWCGATWSRVGTPLWRFEDNDITLKERWWSFTEIAVDLPVSRGSLETFVLYPKLSQYMGFWWTGTLFCVPLLMAAVMARARSIFRRRDNLLLAVAPQHWIVGGWSFGLVILLSASAQNFVEGVPHLGTDALLRAVPWVIPIAAIVLQGPYWVFFMGAYGIVDICIWMLLCEIYWRRPLEKPSGTGAICFVGVSLIIALRIRGLRISKQMLQDDKKRYDQLWEQLCKTEDGWACILHLQKVVCMIGLDNYDNCRQHNRMRADSLAPAIRSRYMSPEALHSSAVNPLFWSLGRIYVPGRASKHSKVSSFNQLVAAAAIANLLLQQRLCAWAQGSGGMFRAAGKSD